jgi:glycerol-1-phosphate dehydrogenase [NAD(P)+]
MNIKYAHDFLEQQLPRDQEILAVVAEPLFERTSSNFQNHNIYPVLPPAMEEKELERWCSELPQKELVVGIGGGVCMDAAKFVAWKNGQLLWQAPSIVSVDAAVTETIGIRREGIVKYIGTIWPEKVLVDIDLIQSAPKHINRAGSGDILSIHTALYDWKLASEITGEPYYPGVAGQSKQLLDRISMASSDIYNVTSAGIKELMNLYVAEVDLCQQMGNSGLIMSNI